MLKNYNFIRFLLILISSCSNDNNQQQSLSQPQPLPVPLPPIVGECPDLSCPIVGQSRERAFMLYDNCVCGTLDGFFVNPTSLETELCDEDLDGWVRRAAGMARRHPESALRNNARCLFSDVHTVVLHPDEPNTSSITVSLQFPMTLLESARTDSDRELRAFIRSSGFSERLPAAKVNALTKWCALDTDLNDNGFLDTEEVQLAENLFSHFMETHTNWLENLGDQTILHIKERVRQQDNFPFEYVNEDRERGGDGSNYWRQCRRKTNFSTDFYEYDGMNHAGQFECLRLLLPGNITSSFNTISILETNQAFVQFSDPETYSNLYRANICHYNADRGVFCNTISDESLVSRERAVWGLRRMPSDTRIPAAGCIDECRESPCGIEQCFNDPNDFGRFSCRGSSVVP